MRPGKKVIDTPIAPRYNESEGKGPLLPCGYEGNTPRVLVYALEASKGIFGASKRGFERVSLEENAPY